MEVFPTENPVIYYKPSKTVIVDEKKKTQPAKGKFYNKYRNHRTGLSKISDLNREESDSSDTEINESEIDEKQAESVEWLQSHRGEEDEIIFHWIQSEPVRQNQRKLSSFLTVNSIYDKWPVLRNLSLAPKLIDLDFKSMRLTKVSLNQDLLQTFFSEVCALKIKTTKSENYRAYKSVLKLLSTNDSMIIIFCKLKIASLA